jgi:tetratricopeptide (TPR) repeat protein
MLKTARDPGDLDGFRWQLKSTRHFVQELPGKIAETAHLSALIDSLDFEGPPRHGIVRMGLIAYAYYLNQEARLEDALDILELASRTHDGGYQAEEYASFAMFVGRVNRRLARWQAARRSYEAAEKTAAQIGDQRTVFFCMLGLANLHRGTGDLAQSRAIVEQVLAQSESSELADVRSAAYSDLSAVCERQGDRVGAVVMEYHAFQTAVDDTSRWRSLANLGSSLAGIGEFEAARYALEVVATRSEIFASRTNAIIELVGLTSAVGDELGFRRYLRAAEEQKEAMPPSMAVDFHYNAGIGMARFGKVERARELLTAALELAQTHSLNTWYFRVERVLEGLDACAETEDAPVSGESTLDKSPLGDVTSGLRELATASL